MDKLKSSFEEWARDTLNIGLVYSSPHIKEAWDASEKATLKLVKKALKIMRSKPIMVCRDCNIHWACGDSGFEELCECGSKQVNHYYCAEDIDMFSKEIELNEELANVK